MKDMYYICSPYKDADKFKMVCNQYRAKGLCEEIEELVPDCKAVAPHAWLPYLLDDTVPEQREVAIKFGIDLLSLCQYLVICGDVVTEGMRNEIAFARKNNIKIIKYKGGKLYDYTIPENNS
jgi:hypothetical protein